DLLLLLAEAQVETGDLAGAMANVNLVRARAGVTAQGPGTSRADLAIPINDARITWAVYRVGQYTSFPNAAYARTAVRAERRLELAMEGQRLFDLRRYGLTDAAAASNGYINGEGGGAEKDRRPYKQFAETWVAKHMPFPIPQRQLELSRGTGVDPRKQNPGW